MRESDVLGRLEASLEHYTKFLSLSKPLGEDVFEFLLVTKDEVGVTSKITGEIARHNVDILSIDGANDSEIGRFVLTIFCDLAKADCTAQGLADDMRKFAFVTKIEYVDAKGRLFDTFHFPLRIMNKYRAVLMRADPLQRVEKDLEQVLGSAGASIMFEEGKSYARGTWAQFREALPDASSQDIVQNTVDGLRATGWGIFEFHMEQDAFQVSIRNPPLSKDRKTSESMFVRGLATGVTESVYGLKLEVQSAVYDENSGTLRLTLEKAKK
jgi:predicted amino acid-binding ACT domain protein